MIRRPPRSTLDRSSAASDVYKRQMIDGVFRHQDSNGGGGLITDGDTQWMTAGGGILHIEAPPEEVVMRGGLFHGFQLWVNLPARLKMTPPRYQDIRGGAVKLLSSPAITRS